MRTPLIQVSDLSIELSGNTILDRISLEINEGNYISIIGPNGAGKTTLIKCLAGIHLHWTGSIRIAGRAFSDYNSRERARLQSYVPQADGRASALTVEEFVAMGRYPHLSAFTSLKPADYTAINNALDRAGIEPFRKRRLNTLSGGERQMAFIAAALAQETKIILLDEPSTFLDYRHQSDVAATLRSACRDHGITVVAVHHDINTATASSDRIIAIKNGRITFEGTPSETANTEVLKNIYQTEFELTPRSPLPVITAGGAL